MSSLVTNQPDGSPERPRPRALRHGLAYGAVMATGGAGQLAGIVGLPGAARPLVWLAVGEAAWIAGRGLIRHRRELRLPLSAWAQIGPPVEHAGVLTVPLGLAVVATGLSMQSGPANALGVALLVLSWLSGAVFVSRFVVSVTRRDRPEAADGGWFLAPAALLGAGIAAAAYSGQAVGVMADLLQWLALLAAGLGVVGYWAVVASTARAVRRRGLGQSHRVLWWIAAGCGGLGAAAIGHVLAATRALLPPGDVAAGHAVAGATWSLAAILAVPIVVASVRSLARNRRIMSAAPWPPTFSTAVFALGALASGKMLGVPAVSGVGQATAGATLALLGGHCRTARITAPAGCSSGRIGSEGGPRRADHATRGTGLGGPGSRRPRWLNGGTADVAGLPAPPTALAVTCARLQAGSCRPGTAGPPRSGSSR